jgi:hypothetical protein
LVFGRELCLLMEALEDESPGCFQEMLYEIVDSILMAPASSFQLIRTWLLEIFVRCETSEPSAALICSATVAVAVRRATVRLFGVPAFGHPFSEFLCDGLLFYIFLL